MAFKQPIKKVFFVLALFCLVLIAFEEVESCCCSYWHNHKTCDCNAFGCNCNLQGAGLCYYKDKEDTWNPSIGNLDPHSPRYGSCAASEERCEDGYWWFGRKRRSIEGNLVKE